MRPKVSFTPDVVGLPATCTEAGSASISNYDSGLTYNFFPAGPSVGTGGLISGTTPGSLYTVVASVGACTSDPSSPFGVEEQLEAPTVEITGDLTVCEGATTMLTASGSTSYQWDDPANTSGSDLEVGAGTFTVTATSVAGCVSTASATVSEVANPQVFLGDDQQVCGQAIVTVDAGSGYTSYLWSNGASTQTAELASGTQWVEVSDGTCAGSDTIIITATANPNPSISPNGAQVICDGGRHNSRCRFGFSSYSWEPNGEQSQTIEVTESGSYSLVVLDDLGCNGFSDTVTVTIENLADVTIMGDGPLVFCEGDSVVLDAGSGYDTYLWSNGDTTQTSTILATGEYSVSGTSGGCEFSSDTVTTEVATVQVSITTDETLLSVDAGFVSYQWFQNGAPIPEQPQNPTRLIQMRIIWFK